MVCFWSNLEKVIFLIFFTDVLLLETEALINLEKPQVTFYLELKHRSFFFFFWSGQKRPKKCHFHLDQFYQSAFC